MIKNIIIFTLLLITSCVRQSEKSSETCLSPILEKSIIEYINENEHFRIVETDNKYDTIYNYYSVYFHNQYEKLYFTICQSPWPGYVLFPEVRKNDIFFYLLFTINKRSVYLICKKSVTIDGLFKNCEEDVNLLRTEINSANLPTYDGSYYPVTYEYYRVKNKVYVNKLNEPNLDFAPEWKRFEEYNKERSKIRTH